MIAYALCYVILLATGVGIGLPMGLAVAGAGTIFGFELGLLVVAAGQLIGLIAHWNLCRHWCRFWFIKRFKRRKRMQWLLNSMDSPMSWQTILLLRLSLLPTAAVNTCCALSATHWRPYALSSGVLMLKLAFVVNAGSLGVSAIRNEDSILRSYLLAVTVTATVMGTAFASRTVLRRPKHKSVLDIAKRKGNITM